MEQNQNNQQVEQENDNLDQEFTKSVLNINISPIKDEQQKKDKVEIFEEREKRKTNLQTFSKFSQRIVQSLEDKKRKNSLFKKGEAELQSILSNRLTNQKEKEIRFKSYSSHKKLNSSLNMINNSNNNLNNQQDQVIINQNNNNINDNNSNNSVFLKLKNLKLNQTAYSTCTSNFPNSSSKKQYKISLNPVLKNISQHKRRTQNQPFNFNLSLNNFNPKIDNSEQQIFAQTLSSRKYTDRNAYGSSLSPLKNNVNSIFSFDNVIEKNSPQPLTEEEERNLVKNMTAKQKKLYIQKKEIQNTFRQLSEKKFFKQEPPSQNQNHKSIQILKNINIQDKISSSSSKKQQKQVMAQYQNQVNKQKKSIIDMENRLLGSQVLKLCGQKLFDKIKSQSLHQKRLIRLQEEENQNTQNIEIQNKELNDLKIQKSKNEDLEESQVVEVLTHDVIDNTLDFFKPIKGINLQKIKDQNQCIRPQSNSPDQKYLQNSIYIKKHKKSIIRDINSVSPSRRYQMIDVEERNRKIQSLYNADIINDRSQHIQQCLNLCKNSIKFTNSLKPIPKNFGVKFKSQKNVQDEENTCNCQDLGSQQQKYQRKSSKQQIKLQTQYIKKDSINYNKNKNFLQNSNGQDNEEYYNLEGSPKLDQRLLKKQLASKNIDVEKNDLQFIIEDNYYNTEIPIHNLQFVVTDMIVRFEDYPGKLQNFYNENVKKNPQFLNKIIAKFIKLLVFILNQNNFEKEKIKEQIQELDPLFKIITPREFYIMKHLVNEALDQLTSIPTNIKHNILGAVEKLRYQIIYNSHIQKLTNQKNQSHFNGIINMFQSNTTPYFNENPENLKKLAIYFLEYMYGIMFSFTFRDILKKCINNFSPTILRNIQQYYTNLIPNDISLKIERMIAYKFLRLSLSFGFLENWSDKFLNTKYIFTQLEMDLQKNQKLLDMNLMILQLQTQHRIDEVKKRINPYDFSVLKFLIETFITESDTYGIEDIIHCIEEYLNEKQQQNKFSYIFECWIQGIKKILMHNLNLPKQQATNITNSLWNAVAEFYILVHH